MSGEYYAFPVDEQALLHSSDGGLGFFGTGEGDNERQIEIDEEGHAPSSTRQGEGL